MDLSTKTGSIIVAWPLATAQPVPGKAYCGRMSEQAAAKRSARVVNRTDVALIALVTISWGLSYPIMKFVVNAYPPATFRALSFAVGVVSLWLYMRWRGDSLAVPTALWPRLGKLSLMNMMLWHAGLIYGLTLLASGRAATIGYTMPVWATLAAVLWFGERLTWRGLLGLLLALGSTALLAQHEWQAMAGQPLGLALVLGAAMAWGTGTAMMKHTPVALPQTTVTFWMLVLAMLMFTVLALTTETQRWAWPDVWQWLAIIYGGAWTFAVCYVAWFTVVKKLTPTQSGLSVTLVPVFGVLGGVWFLGETLVWVDLAALGLTLAAMAVVLGARSR